MTCIECWKYIAQDRLERLHEYYGDEVFPLDAEWAHCRDGPDYWLNCRERKSPMEEAE